CRTLSCALNGAERVTEALTEKLGIAPGQTDADATFTLVEVECLGACDRAPVVMVNDAGHECLQPEDAAKLVDDLRARGEAAVTGCHHIVETGVRGWGLGIFFGAIPLPARPGAELVHARFLSGARGV